MFGLLASIVFLPYITFGKWDRRRKLILLLVGLGGLVTLYVLTFTLIYTEQYISCSWCHYFSCVDWYANFCADNTQNADLPPTGL